MTDAQKAFAKWYGYALPIWRERVGNIIREPRGLARVAKAIALCETLSEDDAAELRRILDVFCAFAFTREELRGILRPGVVKLSADA
jgi:hypothetical protein